MKVVPKFFFVLLFFLLSITCFGNGRDPIYDYYQTKIVAGYVNEQYDSIIIYAYKKYELAKRTNDFAEKDLNIRYILDGCLGLKNYIEAEKALLLYGELKNSIQASIENPEFPSTQSYPIIFSYNYFKSLIEYSQNKSNIALESINVCIDFVNGHPEYYLNDRNQTSNRKYELRQNRIHQCLLQRGNIYLDLHENELAYSNYVEAFRIGKQVDSIDANKYGETWGKQQKALLALINFAVITKQSKKLEQWMSQYAILAPSQRNQLANKKSIYTSTIKELQKKSDQSKNIIDFLSTSSFTKHDPNVRLEIIKFYVRSKDFELALKAVKDYKLNVDISYESIYNKVDFLIAETELFAWQNNSRAMENSIKNLEKLVIPSNALKIKSSQGICNAYKIAFEKSRSPLYLLKIQDRANDIYSFLSQLRYSKERGEDHSVIMKEFHQSISTVLEASHNLYVLNGNIDIDLFLNYIELNKSFSLQNERLLRVSLLNPAQRDRFNNIMLQIKNNEPQVRSATSPDHDAVLLDVKLRKEKRELLDSATIPEIGKITLHDVQNALLPLQSIIEYFFDGDFIYTIHISKSSYSIHKQKLTSEDNSIDLKNSILGYLNLIEPTNFNDGSQWVKHSTLLYQKLFGMLDIPTSEKLIIIPDNVLSTIPFSCLLTGKPIGTNYRSWPFLIKSHSISIQHSLKFWLALNFDKYKSDKSGILVYSPKVSDLKFNQIEAKALYGQYKNVKLVNKSIKDISYLSLNAQKATALHITTHAHSDLSSEQKTYIRSQTDTLYAEEIAYEDFANDLVVLSACETGTGNIIQGEGVYSLARNFFKSGTRAVVSTLWKINDMVSSRQLLKFYQNLEFGMNKDDAITNMQLNFIRDKNLPIKYAMPHYWAAYQCQGDLRPLIGLRRKSFVEANIYYILSLSIGIIVVLAVLYWIKRIYK